MCSKEEGRTVLSYEFMSLIFSSLTIMIVQLLGLIEWLPHQDIFSNSPMENPGLLGNVGKCPISCDGALKKMHLEGKNIQRVRYTHLKQTQLE